VIYYLKQELTLSCQLFTASIHDKSKKHKKKKGLIALIIHLYIEVREFKLDKDRLQLGEESVLRVFSPVNFLMVKLILHSVPFTLRDILWLRSD
jgi:hypothetical protein